MLCYILYHTERGLPLVTPVTLRHFWYHLPWLHWDAGFTIVTGNTAMHKSYIHYRASQCYMSRWWKVLPTPRISVTSVTRVSHGAVLTMKQYYKWSFVTVRQSRFFVTCLQKRDQKLAKITVNIFDLTRNTKIHQVKIRKGVQKFRVIIFHPKIDIFISKMKFRVKGEFSCQKWDFVSKFRCLIQLNNFISSFNYFLWFDRFFFDSVEIRLNLRDIFYLYHTWIS